MVVCNECIKNVLSRIYLNGIANNGEVPQLYWDAIQALEKLDKSCLTVSSTSDPNCPLGWRRNNYPILVVGKKSNRLKFSYTKKQLNNGEILIIVEEVADTYGNILTENNNKKKKLTMKNKKVIRLTESDLHNIIQESVITLLNEMDWTDYVKARKKHPNLMKQVDARTFANRAKGINAQGKDRNDDQQAMRHAARHAWNDDFGYENHVKYGNGDVDADSLGMWGSMEAPCDYGIERNLSKYRNHSCVSREDSGIYNPKVDKTYKPSNGISKGVGIDGIPKKGLEVAKQMAQGNGKYIPKKGWQ